MAVRFKAYHERQYVGTDRLKAMDVALVLGAEGQLGSAFVRSLEGKCRVIAADLEQVDVCDATALSHLTRDVRPDAILNCTAWNAVDQAEERPLAALYTNAYAV